MEKKPLWSGRFSEGMDESVLEFTSSLNQDRLLAFYDVMGSIAHAKMLGEQGILPEKDAEAILGGLRKIAWDIMEGNFSPQWDVEDIHTAIELALTEDIGPVGGKLHTARSRNDQVATDLRMFAMDALLDVISSVTDLIEALATRASEHSEDIVPGFTHMQHAQPVTLGHHLLAHAFRMTSDLSMLWVIRELTSECPLGSAALAGTTYPVDRFMVAGDLGFDEVSPNSMHAVSDRDFVVETLFRISMIAVHLSSIAEEFVIWSSQEFGFVEMDDAFATGSSIMPQKKNPDVAELVRGRTGSSIGNLVSMLVTLKGLPMTYNRDLQEDKKPLIDSIEGIIACLDMMTGMVSTVKFDTERMRNVCESGFLNATDLADYLVTKDVPFREAHGIVGAVVRQCIEKGCRIEDLTLKELKKHSKAIGEDVFEYLPIEACVARRSSYGGTSPENVEYQLELFSNVVEAVRERIDEADEEREAVWKSLLE